MLTITYCTYSLIYSLTFNQNKKSLYDSTITFIILAILMPVELALFNFGEKRYC